MTLGMDRFHLWPPYHRVKGFVKISPFTTAIAIPATKHPSKWPLNCVNFSIPSLWQFVRSHAIVVPGNVSLPPISQQEASFERKLRDAQAIEGYTTPTGITLHSPIVLCARDGSRIDKIFSCCTGHIIRKSYFAPRVVYHTSSSVHFIPINRVFSCISYCLGR